MMTISVVIPVYNGEKYIEQAIKSVVHQPYKNIEIICVDDGSTDKSVEIVSEIVKTINNIKLIKKNNGGVGSARNAGLDAATGDYVAFLDQDDVWLNTLTPELVASIEKEKCDMVAFSSCCSNQSISRVRVEKRENGLVYCTFDSVPMYHHSSYLYNRVFLRENKIFTDRYDGKDYNYRNEDVRFLIQCYAFAHSIQCVSRVLFVYRNNPHSVVHESKGIQVLTSSLDGFCVLAEKTNCEDVRRVCHFYTTRYFLELLDILSFQPDCEDKAQHYYEHYKIESLIREGYASEYSIRQYDCWKNNPKDFWRFSRSRMRKQRFRTALGQVSFFREFYHRKKYPIDIKELLGCYDQNPLSDP